MSEDERPSKKARRGQCHLVGQFQLDEDLDRYIVHLRRYGGTTRSRRHHLLTTSVAQLLWFGDVPKRDIEDLRNYHSVFFILNTDDPITSRSTGGTHWFLVVVCRDPSGIYSVLIMDSSRSDGHEPRLPCSKYTKRNLAWLSGCLLDFFEHSRH